LEGLLDGIPKYINIRVSFLRPAQHTLSVCHDANGDGKATDLQTHIIIAVFQWFVQPMGDNRGITFHRECMHRNKMHVYAQAPIAELKGRDEPMVHYCLPGICLRRGGGNRSRSIFSLSIPILIVCVSVGRIFAKTHSVHTEEIVYLPPPPLISAKMLKLKGGVK